MTGERKLAMRKAALDAAARRRTARRILYYDDGMFFTYDIDTGKSSDITSRASRRRFFNDGRRPQRGEAAARRRSAGRKDSAIVLLTDGWDIWKVPARGGTAGKPDGQRQEGQDPLSRTVPPRSGREREST